MVKSGWHLTLGLGSLGGHGLSCCHLGTHVVGQPGSLRPPTGQSQWWGKRGAMVRICDRDRVWGGAGLNCLLLVTSLSPQDLGFHSVVG